jgi:hypothetical protein
MGGTLRAVARHETAGGFERGRSLASLKQKKNRSLAGVERDEARALEHGGHGQELLVEPRARLEVLTVQRRFEDSMDPSRHYF